MDDLETIIKELLHTKDPESLIKKLIAEEEDLFQKVIANLRYSGKARGVEAGDSRVVDLLLELLTNEDSKVRRAVIAALGAIGDSRAVVPLLELLTKEDPEIRETTIEALDLLIGDSRAVVPLLELLTNEDSKVRRAVIAALGAIGDRRAVESLIELLQDEDPEIRETVIAALGAIGDRRAVDPLIELLQELQDEDPFRWYTIEALGAIGDSRAVVPLLELLTNEDSKVRRAVIEALGELADPKVIDPLLKQLKDESVRWVAAKALGAIGTPRLDTTLHQLDTQSKEIYDFYAGRTAVLSRLLDNHGIKYKMKGNKLIVTGHLKISDIDKEFIHSGGMLKLSRKEFQTYFSLDDLSSPLFDCLAQTPYYELHKSVDFTTGTTVERIQVTPFFQQNGWITLEVHADEAAVLLALAHLLQIKLTPFIVQTHNGHVVGLSLAGLGVQTKQHFRSLPVFLKNLPQLQWLNLRANGLFYIPNVVTQLEQLVYLDLLNNQLQKFPESFSELKNLKFLNIESNKFTFPPYPQTLQDCESLLAISHDFQTKDNKDPFPPISADHLKKILEDIIGLEESSSKAAARTWIAYEIKQLRNKEKKSLLSNH